MQVLRCVEQLWMGSLLDLNGPHRVNTASESLLSSGANVGKARALLLGPLPSGILRTSARRRHFWFDQHLLGVLGGMDVSQIAATGYAHNTAVKKTRVNATREVLIAALAGPVG